MKDYKTFEQVKILRDFAGSALRLGDRVIFNNKKSYNYLNTGTIDTIYTVGDVLVKLDYQKDEFHTSIPSNLMKIDMVIEKTTGEIIIIPFDNMEDLVEIGVIEYDNKKKIYLFDEDNRWQIERYSY